MRRILLDVKGLFFLVLILSGPPVFASGEVLKSPILDRVKILYSAPSNLEDLTLEQLHEERAVLEKELNSFRQASDAPEIAKQKFLETVFEHDDKRLQIVGVIRDLIDEYQIEGKFRDDLIGYSNTFDVAVRNARKHVHTLEDYRSYDFRFSAVYMSMMMRFNEDPEFRKRMVEDMQNPDTPWGKYRKEIDESYAEVQRKKFLIQNIYSVNELERAVTSIDEEISRRGRTQL